MSSAEQEPESKSSQNIAVYQEADKRFSQAAQGYVSSESHAKGAELKLMVALAEAEMNLRGKRLLDVATGGGHVALAFARAGAKVTVTDLSLKMLQTADDFISSQGAQVDCVQAAAESLPFDDNRFDIVTCRIAAHHFAQPAAFLHSAARVLKKGGILLLVDNISPEDEALAQTMNHIEKMRDPSHVMAYSVLQWSQWLAEAGFAISYLERFKRAKDYEIWFRRMGESEGARGMLEQLVLALPQHFKDYFEVKSQGDKLLSLSHEVICLKS
ncbi:MAG: class I SAM-dependent methyltransferase [Deinococcales bacterium]